jgi:hypothetical protein
MPAVGGRCVRLGDSHMATILLFALAAAVYPQLLAVVVIILTRPEPKPLLWACYLGSLVVGVGCGIAFVAIFRSHGSVAGTSSTGLGPSAYLAVGGIAVALAIFVATRPGRDVFRRYLPRRRRRYRNDEEALGTAKGVTSRVHQALEEGSLALAAVAGVILAVPGPFDLLAFGRLARSGDATIELGALIVVFALIKFLLIEVPIIGYTISPARTSAQVNRFSGWMNANKLEMIAAVVGVIGLGLIVEGIVDLA